MKQKTFALFLCLLLWLATAVFLQSTHAAPTADLCFTEWTGDNTTDFASPDAQALRDAITAAPIGGTVKIAGTCAGAILESGTIQVALINKSLTLAGGYSPSDWTISDPVADPTILDAQSGGRVIYATAALTVRDLTVQNGRTTAANEHGAGIYTTQPITLDNVTLSNNETTGSNAAGGGAYLGNTAVVTATTAINNTANGYGGGLYTSGLLHMENSLITLNTGTTPGGLQTFGTSYITNTTFLSNTATAGYGGGADFQGAATLNGVRFEGNQASSTAGGANFSGMAQVTDSIFVNNRGSSGHAVTLSTTTSKRFVNVLFDRHPTTTSTQAVILINNGSSIEFNHVTIANPTPTIGRAIRITDGTVSVTNTIIANYATGLSRSAGTVSEDYNLFDNVSTPSNGTITSGGNSITAGTAAFVSPASGNYQLSGLSQAIDAGTNAAVAVDFFGNSRPQGGGFDIGFHEMPYTATSCGVANGGNYLLGANPVQIEVVEKGAIDCLTAVYVPTDHPTATLGIETGGYWAITAVDSGNNPVTGGFTVTLTIPVTFVPDVDDKVCRFTDPGWDCAMTSFDALNQTITRAGVNGFSDWAAGDEVGPLAVTNLTQQTTTPTSNPLPVLLATLLATLTNAWLWARRPRRSTFPKS